MLARDPFGCGGLWARVERSGRPIYAPVTAMTEALDDDDDDMVDEDEDDEDDVIQEPEAAREQRGRRRSRSASPTRAARSTAESGPTLEERMTRHREELRRRVLQQVEAERERQRRAAQEGQ